jgi:hypothetical protein
VACGGDDGGGFAKCLLDAVSNTVETSSTRDHLLEEGKNFVLDTQDGSDDDQFEFIPDSDDEAEDHQFSRIVGKWRRRVVGLKSAVKWRRRVVGFKIVG